jgi:hypothetical protein
MKLKLIDEWRNSYRFASVQFAAIAAILAGVLAANPGMVLGLIGFLPAGPMRTVAAVLVGIVVFVIPTLTRVLKKAPSQPPQ